MEEEVEGTEEDMEEGTEEEEVTPLSFTEIVAEMTDQGLVLASEQGSTSSYS